jgi:alpha-D-ribose 1-methylphosphonate 5-triphosphate synthase subunit PhnG
VFTVFWWENVRERDHLEDLDVDVAIILKLSFNNWVRQARTGLIWLRKRTGGVTLQFGDGIAQNLFNG